MAGVPAGLPAGVRLSDHISLGVIARAVPPDRVRQILAETGRASERERDLPAQVMVYYAIALALYMGSSTREVLRCLLEGLRLSGDMRNWFFRTFGAGDARRAAAIGLKRAGIPGLPAELAPVRADTGSCSPKTQVLQGFAAARQPRAAPKVRKDPFLASPET